MALLRRRRATALWPHIAMEAASKYLFSGSGLARAVVSCWRAMLSNSCFWGSRHASRNLWLGSSSDILCTLSLASSILPIGKGKHIRTVPGPAWAQRAVDKWTEAAGISTGRIFRRVNRFDKIWGEGITPKAIWHVVRAAALGAGIKNLAPQVRTCARLCHVAGGELEQIQFLLGHASVQTTERYLGCKQELRHPSTTSLASKTLETLSCSPRSGLLAAVVGSFRCQEGNLGLNSSCHLLPDGVQAIHGDHVLAALRRHLDGCHFTVLDYGTSGVEAVLLEALRRNHGRAGNRPVGLDLDLGSHLLCRLDARGFFAFA